MAITREILQTLRLELTEAMAQIGNRLNLKITTGNCTFNPKNAVMKIEIATITEDGQVMNKEVETFMIMAKLWKLDPADLGRSFSYNGKTYTICGAKVAHGRGIDTIYGKAANGQTYRFRVDMVRAMLVLAKET